VARLRRLDRDLGGLEVADSPTMMMSGSCRRNERSAVANVSPAFSLMFTWLMPASGFPPDLGGRDVDVGLVRMLRQVYSEIVLPLPVGPWRAPCRRAWIACISAACCSGS